MNAPFLDRSRVHAVLDEVGARHGLSIIGLLPTGCVSHMSEPRPLVFLAEKARESLSLLEVCSAEVELQDRTGFASRILMRSELTSSQRGTALLAESRPL